MQEKKRQEKIIPLPELRSTITEILVANGRSFQPFVRTFHYTGENITKSNLGSLIGVFEIDELSEDCAYIVNFLASVAKKEYFSNPRRGAIESFEAALHKINLALSELVKHGNVTWLGKLHGTLAVLEKNNVHFSVTGQAKILLLRNNTVSDISEGLASEESQLHPIKTFVEVSSGRLTLSDRIILTSPELLALFSVDDLAKNARRMDPGQFLQFLKTALINELDMSGVLLVQTDEEVTVPLPKPPKKPAEEKSLERVQNIFSQSAFLPKNGGVSSVQESLSLTPSQSSIQEKPKEEYTDTKTGHIYVQGAITEDPGQQHMVLERVKFKLEEVFDTTRSVLFAQKKWLRKGKKQLIITVGILNEESRSLGKKIGRASRRFWRRYQTTAKEHFSKDEPTPSEEIMSSTVTNNATPTSSLASPEKIVLNPTLPPESLQQESTPVSQENEEIPSFMKEKVAFFYQKHITPLTVSLRENSTKPETSPALKTPVTSLFSQTLPLIKKYGNQSLVRIQNLPFQKLKRGASFISLATVVSVFRCLPNMSLYDKKWFKPVSFLLLGLTLIGFLFWKFPRTPSVPTTEEQTSPLIQDSSAPLSSLEKTLVLDTTPTPIIASVILNDQAYAITENAILTVPGNKSFPLPESKAKFATAMDDLRLIFVLLENGKLYAWSPIATSFVENTLVLPEGATITGIDTYLTYLYVLDSTHDQVYRFPRAPGGFGAGTSWLKESVAIEPDSHLAVNESLFIALNPTTAQGFFRGRITNTLEIPDGGLSLTDFYTHPGLTNVYALDADHAQILIWNQEGKLLQKLHDEKLSAGQTLSVNEKTREVFVSTGNTLLSYKLK